MQHARIYHMTLHFIAFWNASDPHRFVESQISRGALVGLGILGF